MNSDGRFFRRWSLLAPAVLAPAVETAVLLTFGPRDAASLGPQVSAPPPFGLFHDLRWISVYHNSWAMLALELMGVIVLRSAYVAWMVQHSWPDDHAPSMPSAARRVLVFHALASMLLFPWVTLLFGLAVTHLSYLFFVALPAVVLIALTIHRGAVSQAMGRWWTWRPSARSLGWIAASFGWLTVAGAVVASAPAPVAVLAAAGAGLLNARAYYGIVQGLARTPERRRLRFRVQVVPVTLAATFALVLVGAYVGFGPARASGKVAQGAIEAIPSAAQGHPVLVAAGFGSRWDSATALHLPNGFVAWRYSYRGLDDFGRPLSYGPPDTLQPLMVSAIRLGQQVDALHRAYGEPVALVAESEGGLVARTYLLRLYSPSSGAVDRVVILDMVKGQASVYYPRPGSEGWGVGSGWALRGLAVVIRSLGPLPVWADAPLIRDLLDCRSLVAAAASAPLPQGIEETSIHALADAVDDLYGHRIQDARVYVVRAAHGGLVRRPNVQLQIAEFLSGVPRGKLAGGVTMAGLVAAISGPWETPELASGLAPAGSSC